MVLTAEQLRAWDEYTIVHEPVSPIDLMERAAAQCVAWLEQYQYLSRTFSIFCGKGNNGGDGLAIARMLSNKGCEVSVHILEFGNKGTNDFQLNLARLHGLPVTIRFIQPETNLGVIPQANIVIDALLGSGLNRPVEGVTANLVNHINGSGNEIISIDVPSGLSVDQSSVGTTIINASHTLSFQCYKPALLMAENEKNTGEVHILDIGLHQDFLQDHLPAYHWIDASLVNKLYRPRERFSHKGSFGHALIIAGSHGKLGAAVLAARACMRSGVGLLTMQVPASGLQVIQVSVPEAMCAPDKNETVISVLPDDISVYDVIGIGPGLGRNEITAALLEALVKKDSRPMVFDADALNIISNRPGLVENLPPYSVLTPHPKEFERLFGKTSNEFERIELAKTKARSLKLIIVLKGHHTFIATPSGIDYFNSTGNAGMATGGTGDVLTGIITGLMAQGYEPGAAAVFGVWWHGLAGDLAAGFYTQESLVASDLIEALGPALAAASKQWS